MPIFISILLAALGVAAVARGAGGVAMGRTLTPWMALIVVGLTVLGSSIVCFSDGMVRRDCRIWGEQTGLDTHYVTLNDCYVKLPDGRTVPRGTWVTIINDK